MSLHDLAINDNRIFFDQAGFGVSATLQSSDAQNMIVVTCLFVSIDEKKDLEVGDAQGFVRRSFRQLALSQADLPSWFDQKSIVLFEGDAKIYFVDRIAHDNSLGRVHVWLKEQARNLARGTT